MNVEERLDKIEHALIELSDAIEWGHRYNISAHIRSILGTEVKANAVDATSSSLSAE
jgi:hypothetical protein